MPLRTDERASRVSEIDRFEDGVGWIAHPEETMRRASHALAVDDEVWVLDPVDGDGVDELLAEYGEVGGVVVAFDRHVRDAATVADRHDVPVYLPDWFDGVAAKLDADTPIVRFGAELADTGVEAHVVRNGRFWKEVALYDPSNGTLVVSEAVGTAPYFLAGDERLGVHPMLRPIPPRDRLGRFEPERVLVGHGEGVTADAAAALADALDGSRRRIPHLYAEQVRRFLPV